ncbi:AAA family ATPase [Ahrensia sp. 13_GOM-1096m]|uniref:AAA family ATPase n=1 Tax=Ahrensia sp. 13_GOM-1096m TaxID=1380380 RepID=UPI00047D6176|nr:AAA family ATPase [Ahrensia sp. 13_GOM-1096m]
MLIRLDRITITDFKRIQTLTIDLKPLTALIGGNTSGKSSALQAAQLGISILQAAFLGRNNNGTPKFSGTVSNDAVLFRPTERLLDLRRGGGATQYNGFSIKYDGFDLETEEELWVKIDIRRGKNANIAITRTGIDSFAAALANGDKPFSILTPGLSGIPIREEWRTKGAMDAAIMHGDANLYLRTVLDHLFARDLNEEAMEIWRQDREIEQLPESGWKTFSSLLDVCYPGARVIVNHDQHKDRYVNVDVESPGSRVTIDMASTGMLQVIQIVAYACFYAPPLLLLDEPDAHLHADSQSRLYEALRGVAAKTNTRILFASHSPQLIQRLMFDEKAALAWMSEGEKVPVDATQRPAIPILMTLGALSAGGDVFDPARPVILMTEDKITHPVTTLARANGAPDSLAVLSYNGCGNLPAARLLANMIADIRPDVRIVIHRDRDFRTASEVEFEIATAEAERQRNGVTRVYEVFTPLNDVEHSFAQLNHLNEVFHDINHDDIDETIKTVTALKRDELVNAARTARKQIDSSLYNVPRKRAKPEWNSCGMQDDAPPIGNFIPADGLTPVAFEHTHGKMLVVSLRGAIHQRVGGSSQTTEERFYSSTPHLRTTSWIAAFNTSEA